MGTGSALGRDLIEQGLEILAFDAVGAHQSASPGIREDFTERGFVLLPIHRLHSLSSCLMSCRSGCCSHLRAAWPATASAHFMPCATTFSVDSGPSARRSLIGEIKVIDRPRMECY